jgi:hypothetical protein
MHGIDGAGEIVVDVEGGEAATLTGWEYIETDQPVDFCLILANLLSQP